MSWKAIRYHKEYAPEGRPFEADSESAMHEMSKGLAQEGWVDDPAKLGINVWGVNADLGAIAQLKADFEAGRVPAIAPPGDAPVDGEPDMDALAAEARAQAQEDMREPESIKKRAKMEREEVADTRRSQGRDAKTGQRKRTAVRKKRTAVKKNSKAEG